MIPVLTACKGSNRREGEAKTPSASKAQKGKDYQSVIAEFEKNGFTNIKTEAMGDLVFGWLNKDGEVESVSVDGDEGYSPNRWYPNNVAILITYHSFPTRISDISDDPTSTEEPDYTESQDKYSVSNDEKLHYDVNKGEWVFVNESNPTMESVNELIISETEVEPIASEATLVEFAASMNKDHVAIGRNIYTKTDRRRGNQNIRPKSRIIAINMEKNRVLVPYG